MPIDLLSTIKKTSQFAFSSPLLNNLLGSSLFCALFITIIIMLLIMFIYPAKEGTPMSILCKLFIYSFCGSLIIIFLHDGIIKHMFDEKEQKKLDIDIMQGTNINNRDIVYSSKIITPGLSQLQPAQPAITGSYEGKTTNPENANLGSASLENPNLENASLGSASLENTNSNLENTNSNLGRSIYFSINEENEEPELKAPPPRSSTGGNSFAL